MVLKCYYGSNCQLVLSMYITACSVFFLDPLVFLFFLLGYEVITLKVLLYLAEFHGIICFISKYLWF